MSEAIKFVANRWRTRRSPFPYCHAIIAETDASLERTLPELKPAFLEQYRGGMPAICYTPGWSKALDRIGPR